MKKEIVSQSTSPKSASKMPGVRRSVATLMAAFALSAYAPSSVFAIDKCEPAEFSESGGYPSTAYIYVTTAEPGATIFATVGNHFIPANPTHNGSTPTGTTFICGGTFAVFPGTPPPNYTPGDYKHVKCIVYKAGKADSIMTSYELDNTGN
jgi:hypothetical protein